MRVSKVKAIQFAAPETSDEECTERLAEGYRRSFDKNCLISWEEMLRRIGMLLDRKRDK